MKKMNANETLKDLNYISTNGMSVCNSCANCGGCGSTCQSTCKCFDQNSEINDVRDVYRFN